MFPFSVVTSSKKWSNFDPPAPHKFSTFKLMFRTRVEFAFLILFFPDGFLLPYTIPNNQQPTTNSPWNQTFRPQKEVASSSFFCDHHFFRGKKISVTSAVVVAGPQRLASQNSGFVDQGVNMFCVFLGWAVLNQGCRFVVFNMFGFWKKKQMVCYRSKYWWNRGLAAWFRAKSTTLSMEVFSFELGVVFFGCAKSTTIGFGGPSFGGVEDFVVGWALDFSTQKRALEIFMIFWMTFVTFAKKTYSAS